MATRIVLNRKNELIGKRRGIKVLVDGTELGKTVAGGSSEEYELTPGMHTIQCKINWCKSPELTLSISEGETKFLKVRTAMRYYLHLYIIALLAIVAGLLFRLAKIEEPESFALCQVILIMPFLLYNFYYLSIGRNKYLVLERQDEYI